ncbi:MAG TPA: alpha/beta fold hydrolase [Tepidisphaeraceae bacterium]|nr:alpha/beta fold hydrolase [Tepidisphaeraceae bacterium]
MILPLIMLVSLAIAVGLALLLSAYAVMRPPRMTDGKAVYLLKRLSPGDLNMHFEEMWFKVRDESAGQELNLAGWWIPCPGNSDKTAVLIHGYADAKVGAIAWAPTWQELGYHILAIDLRAHGESGGQYTTAGVLERHDLDQVLNQLRASRSAQSKQIVLFGASLGAMVALATAAMRDDIAAVVMDSPVLRFRDGVRAQVHLLGLPLPGMFDWTMRLAKWLCGQDFDRLNSVDLIAAMKCPVMAIQSGDDPYIDRESAGLIEAAVNRRSDGVYWSLPDVPHLLGLEARPDEYAQRIRQFLKQNNLST